MRKYTTEPRAISIVFILILSLLTITTNALHFTINLFHETKSLSCVPFSIPRSTPVDNFSVQLHNIKTHSRKIVYVLKSQH